MKENKISERTQIAYLVIILLVLIIMMITLVFIVKNKNIIMSDPISYGMEQHNFKSCQCMDDKGVIWYSYENGFINKNSEEIYGGLQWDNKR